MLLLTAGGAAPSSTTNWPFSQGIHVSSSSSNLILGELLLDPDLVVVIAAKREVRLEGLR